MTGDILQMPGAWFRSGWNYTLRAEPTLSESQPEPSLDPAEAGTPWGVWGQGCRAEQRGSGGRRQIPSWKPGTGIFCLSRYVCRLFVCSFIIHSFSQGLSPSPVLTGLCGLQPGTGSEEEPGTDRGRHRAWAPVSLGGVGPVALLPGEGRWRGNRELCSSG